MKANSERMLDGAMAQNSMGLLSSMLDNGNMENAMVMALNTKIMLFIMKVS